jgi:D-apionolactonase
VGRDPRQRRRPLRPPSVRDLSRYQLWYGRDECPPHARQLRAGSLEALFEGSDLRYVRLGSVEVVRRLYVAVRDDNWNTIPPEVTSVAFDGTREAFQVRLEARQCTEVIDFRWRAEFRGGRSGTLECSIEGVAHTDFHFNRIGFCLLHPVGVAAGRPYRARTPDDWVGGVLPHAIAPQPIEDGVARPLIPSFDRLEMELVDGLWAQFEFEGDLFETEDQRNWTDASFKTYSTPIALGFPHRARAGQRIAQHVTISTFGRPRRPPPRSTTPSRISLGTGLGLRLPALGLGQASHGGDLSRHEIELLRRLGLDYLRSDLQLDSESYESELERALVASTALGTGLELAVVLGGAPEDELGAFAGRLARSRARVASILVFHRGELVTSGDWVRLARRHLARVAPAVRWVGGTNAYFAELNRARPAVDAMDAIAYPITPQVHAFDERSLVETLEAQGETVRSAHAFCAGLPIVVSPVTLRPRFNPHAVGPEAAPLPGELPTQVDPRQASLFGAVWTVGSVKYLSESGAASVTYYETTGWRGVMETDSGSPLPELFPSSPGAPFPLYHVFRDLGEWKRGELISARSSNPLALCALAVRVRGSLHVLVANLRPESQRCTVGPVSLARASVRALDEASYASAVDSPSVFRETSELVHLPRTELELELGPYALTRIDL